MVWRHMSNLLGIFLLYPYSLTCYTENRKYLFLKSKKDRLLNNIIDINKVLTKERVETMELNTREKEIERLRIQKEYDAMPNVAEQLVTMFSSGEYPVPVVGIAKNLGFKVFNMDMDDKNLSGMIAIDKKWKKTFGTDKVIVVNKMDSNEHNRFTIAHELAHYLFDSVPGGEYYNTYRTDESQWDVNNKEIDDRERVANYFAANFLMPSLDFRRKYNEFLNLGMINGSEQLESELANYFGVPRTAVKIRFNELGIG